MDVSLGVGLASSPDCPDWGVPSADGDREGVADDEDGAPLVESVEGVHPTSPQAARAVRTNAERRATA